MKWQSTTELTPRSYSCGYCGKLIASAKGYYTDGSPQRWIYTCPNCIGPTYFPGGDQQVPGIAPGVEVAHLPKDVEQLYREARNAVAIRSYTAAVLGCRKLLMHIAVAQGAPVGKSFVEYVEHLADRVTFRLTAVAGSTTFERRATRRTMRSD